MWEGWGGGRAGTFGEGIFLFCVDDKKQTDNSYCSAFFFSLLIPLFLWEKRRGREGKEEEWQEGKKMREM